MSEQDKTKEELDRLNTRFKGGDKSVLGEIFRLERMLKDDEPPLEEQEERAVGRPIKYPDSHYHQKQREAQRRWYERHKESIFDGSYDVTGKRMFYCPECDKPFGSKTSLENHRIVEHGK